MSCGVIGFASPAAMARTTARLTSVPRLLPGTRFRGQSWTDTHTVMTIFFLCPSLSRLSPPLAFSVQSGGERRLRCVRAHHRGAGAQGRGPPGKRRMNLPVPHPRWYVDTLCCVGRKAGGRRRAEERAEKGTRLFRCPTMFLLSGWVFNAVGDLVGDRGFSFCCRLAFPSLCLLSLVSCLFFFSLSALTDLTL